jgi:hypothetical protein
MLAPVRVLVHAEQYDICPAIGESPRSSLGLGRHMIHYVHT